MKCRTKEQQRLLGVIKTLKPLTMKQQAYARANALEHIGIESKGRVKCSVCGNNWRPLNVSDMKSITCPKCKRKLELVHNHSKLIDAAYFCLTESFGDKYQVLRYFWVERKMELYGFNEIGYKIMPVAVIFIRMKDAKPILFTIGSHTMFYRFTWEFGTSFGYNGSKSHIIWREYINAVQTKSVTSILERNGWDGKNLYGHPDREVVELLKNGIYETAYKTKQYEICRSYILGLPDLDDETMKVVLKLSNRYGKTYNRDEWNDFKDYVGDLKYLERDIHNPSVLFPKDFQETKMRINRLAERKRQEARQRAWYEDELRWAKQKSERRNTKIQEWLQIYSQHFSGMRIVAEGFQIRPLITLSDFSDESKEMKHCILTYYGKINTLLLSVTKDGKRVETAEVNLVNNYEIVQCRGHCNQPSQWHQQIVGLLKQSKAIFERYNKQKQIINLPAVSSQWVV